MILQLLKQFSKISHTKEGVTRLGLSDLEVKAHEHAAAQFKRRTSVKVLHDQVGNSFLVNQAAAGPYVVMGSHLDTVPNGGRLDGALGVAAAISAMDRILKKNRKAPLAVAIWVDEEGYRFGNGVFGSRAFAGMITDQELLLTDRDGISLIDVLVEKGLQRKPRRSRETGELVIKFQCKRPIEVAAYAEAHIEQGRRLIDAGKRIGIVTQVVGIRRWRLESIGELNHAGTTPMRERRDALVPIAGMVGRLPQLVRGMQDAVITCGAMGVEPGVANVIPNSAWAVIEHRATSERDQDEIARRLKELVATTGPRAPGVGLEMKPISWKRPKELSESVTDALEQAAIQAKVETMRMVSMAGHDAMAVARVAPSGLFFIPSLKGISHRPDEDSKTDDIKLAADVLYRWANSALQSVP